MQAVLQKNDTIDLLDMLNYIDNTTKNEIENNIVSMGEKIVERLVETLRTAKGIARGVVAMSLIRIGEASIAPLRREAMRNPSFGWIANYLINEIECNI